MRKNGWVFFGGAFLVGAFVNIAFYWPPLIAWASTWTAESVRDWLEALSGWAGLAGAIVTIALIHHQNKTAIRLHRESMRQAMLPQINISKIVCSSIIGRQGDGAILEGLVEMLSGNQQLFKKEYVRERLVQGIITLKPSKDENEFVSDVDRSLRNYQERLVALIEESLGIIRELESRIDQWPTEEYLKNTNASFVIASISSVIRASEFFAAGITASAVSFINQWD